MAQYGYAVHIKKENGRLPNAENQAYEVSKWIIKY
jgi:hypothetical protein